MDTKLDAYVANYPVVCWRLEILKGRTVLMCLYIHAVCVYIIYNIYKYNKLCIMCIYIYIHTATGGYGIDTESPQ